MAITRGIGKRGRKCSNLELRQPLFPGRFVGLHFGSHRCLQRFICQVWLGSEELLADVCFQGVAPLVFKGLKGVVHIGLQPHELVEELLLAVFSRGRLLSTEQK